MSGAASSSTTFGFHGLPQNSVNQRPTTTLLSSCMVMVVITFIHRHSEDARMNGNVRSGGLISSSLAHPGDAHGDVDATGIEAAFMRSCPGIDPRDSMEGQAGWSAEHEEIARGEADVYVGFRPVLGISEPELAGVADG